MSHERQVGMHVHVLFCCEGWQSGGLACRRDMRMFWLLCFLGACGSPAAAPVLDAAVVDVAPDVTIDAAIDGPPPPDLSCLGQPPAMDAPDPFDLTGKVFAIDHYQVHAEVGAIVTVRRRADDTVIGTAPATVDDGSYAVSIATGGIALDAYYVIAADGQLAMRIDPGDPLTTGFFALAITAATDEVQRWYADAGATFDATAPTLVVVVVDCNHAEVAGATIAVAPAARVTYYDPVTPRWDPTASSSPNGFALVTGGDVAETITASWQGHAFPAHPVVVATAGGLTLAVVSPHADAELRAKR